MFFFWLGIDALCSMGSDPWSSFTPTLYIDKNMEMDDLLLLYDLREGEMILLTNHQFGTSTNENDYTFI